MAWYRVEYGCGHEVRHQLYGPGRDRQSWIARQATRVCPDCYKAEQARTALQRADEVGLPTLTGTEKQVAWALSIRDKRYPEFATWCGKQRAMAVEQGKPDAIAALDEVLEWVQSQTESRFWIDNRDSVPTDFFRAGRNCPAALALREKMAAQA